jgi:hypothetical protein
MSEAAAEHRKVIEHGYLAHTCPTPSTREASLYVAATHFACTVQENGKVSSLLRSEHPVYMLLFCCAVLKDCFYQIDHVYQAAQVLAFTDMFNTKLVMSTTKSSWHFGSALAVTCFLLSVSPGRPSSKRPSPMHFHATIFSSNVGSHCYFLSWWSLSSPPFTLVVLLITHGMQDTQSEGGK